VINTVNPVDILDAELSDVSRSIDAELLYTERLIQSIRDIYGRSKLFSAEARRLAECTAVLVHLTDKANVITATRKIIEATRGDQ